MARGAWTLSAMLAMLIAAIAAAEWMPATVVHKPNQSPTTAKP